MTELNADAEIKIDRADEIKILADNINQLYHSLISTIQHLEIEKENVSKAEQEKLDSLNGSHISEITFLREISFSQSLVPSKCRRDILNISLIILP